MYRLFKRLYFNIFFKYFFWLIFLGEEGEGGGALER